MEMNSKMLEILKKAKQIDQAAKKYDSNPELVNKKTSSGGLYDQLGVNSEPSYISENSIKNNPELYEEKIKNSKLPPAIKEAMLKNPIPQPSMVNSMGLTEEQIREVRGEVNHYDEDEDIDFTKIPVPSKKKPTQPMREQKSSNNGGGVYMTPEMVRQIVNEEIKRILPKVAPKIIEHYLQQGLLKENIDILRKIKSK